MKPTLSVVGDGLWMITQWWCFSGDACGSETVAGEMTCNDCGQFAKPCRRILLPYIPVHLWIQAGMAIILNSMKILI